ncbi:MAG: ATP-binding cassette domain-containing protein [Acetobacteraceae bacterium]|nr:ATP-binding cassette domain-containing protein [Acetobacteraceae bacterium]
MSEGRTPAPAGLRLRDVGVTPLAVATVVGLTIFSQLGLLGFIIVMKHVTDGVVTTGNGSTLVGFALLFAFTLIISGLYTHLRAAMLSAVAERFGLRMQVQAMQAAIRSAVRTDTGNGLSVLQDIDQVRRFLGSGGPTIFLDLISGLVALGLLFYVDTTLGLIGVLGILATIVTGYIMYRATRTVMQQARKKFVDTSAELSGQLVHPDLVRGIGLLPATLFHWQGRYEDALASMESAQNRANALLGLESVVAQLHSTAVKVAVCAIIFSHTTGMGLMLIAFFFTNAAIAPFSHLFQRWDGWLLALQAWRRLQEAMRQDGAPEILPAEPEAPRGLLIEDLTFHPPGRARPILTEVTLRLAPGTAAVVQGPNGVGKSTLMRLTLGLMPPTSGRVLLNGQDTYRCDRAELGARIGYLPQDVQLLEGSVFDNIGRGPGAPPEAVVAAARMAGAHEVIGRLPLGYQTPAGATSGLSAGQRRLIGLARALYGEPDLLILDEPEVGLDGYARAAMRGAVAAVRQRGGVALVVTHEPRTWLDVIDLLLLLHPGGTWQVQPATQAQESGGRLATVD